MIRRINFCIPLVIMLAACVPSVTPKPPSPLPPTVDTAEAVLRPSRTHTPTASHSLTPTDTAQPAPSETLLATPPPLPTDAPASAVLVERGNVPPGFSLITVADDLPRITTIVFGPDGALYAGLRHNGVMRLVDADGDHRFESRDQYARGFDELLGLAWLEDTLYISSSGRLSTVRDTDGDGISDTRNDLISNLPIGRHQNNSIVFGPDGRLYMPLGSTCDVCQEPDARNATILSFAADGSDLQIVARGLRNAYDLAFDAQGRLFATDNGRDDLGTDQPPEELNYIVSGSHYGWPDCWGRGQGGNCADTRYPIARFDARSSANGIVFYYDDQFPSDYMGDAFIALFGSYVVDVTPRVVRVQMQPRDDTFSTQVSDFVSGLGRPLDLTVGPDGALYIADYEAEAIFRVNYGAP